MKNNKVTKGTKQGKHFPYWCEISDSNPTSEAYLISLLNFASDNYERHTDYFIRHRDTTLKQLGIVLTAELVMASNIPKISPLVAEITFIFLAILSILLLVSGIKSCYRSFLASLENAVFVSKIIWSMGVSSKVTVAPNDIIGRIPTKYDSTFYVPRYIEHTCACNTTKEFIDYHFKKVKNDRPRNTYYWTRFTVCILGLANVVIGFTCVFISIKH